MIAALAYGAGLLVFGLFQAAGYFRGVLPPGLVASALLFLVLLSCTGVGRIVLRAFVPHELSDSEKTLIGCTLGLGILTQCLFLLGVAGLLRLWAVLALLAGFWVIGFTEMRDVIFSLGANRNLLRERPFWAAGILTLVSLTYAACWVPPHQYDALVYHLPLAAAYARTGRIAPVESLLFSHFPQNGEMLFALALLLKSDVLAQMFSWLACVLSLLWVFEMGKREMPLTAALGACAILASHTAVMLLSSIAYVETIVMLWIAAAVLSFCRWRETTGGGRTPRGWLALSAIFAGLGLGTKYYAGICPASLGCILAVRWARALIGRRAGSGSSAAQSSGDLAYFAALAAAAAAPWLVKNWIVLGNPVFPFFYESLPHRGIPWAAENARRYFEILTEYGHRPGQFLSDLIALPFQAAAGSLRFGGGMDVLGDLGWGLMFAAVPACVLAASKNRTLRLLLIYCVLHGAAWFCTGVVLRFLIVIVPLLSLVAAAGLFQVWNLLDRRGRGLLGSAFAVFAGVNLALFLYVNTVFANWTVLFGVETREEYLYHRLEYYPCARWARDNLDRTARILMVGEQRGYYVAQDHVATTPMAPNRFVEWANQAKDPAEYARFLRAEGRFTHLLFVPHEANRLKDYGIFAFTEQGSKNWAGLGESQLKTVFSPAPGGCVLYEIPEGAAR